MEAQKTHYSSFNVDNNSDKKQEYSESSVRQLIAIMWGVKTNVEKNMPN